MTNDELETLAADTINDCFVYTPEGAASLAAELRKAHDPGAACRLLFEMHDASEDYSCSSWDEGAARLIRDGIHNDGGKLGFLVVTEQTVATCAALAREAGGWWAWDDAKAGLVFLPVAGDGAETK